MKSFFVAFKKQLIISLILVLISFGLFYYNNYIYKPKYSYDYNALTFDDDLGDVLEDSDTADVIREFLPVSNATLSDEGEIVSLNRFWFEKDPATSLSGDGKLDEPLLFYVEYESGNNRDTEQKRVLLRRKSEGNYEVTGVFRESRNEWELESGEDLLLGKEIILYEKINGEWIRKD